MPTDELLDQVVTSARADLRAGLTAEAPDIGVVQRRRSRRRVAGGVVVAVLALAVAVPVLRGGDGSSRVVTGPTDEAPGPGPASTTTVPDRSSDPVGSTANADLLEPGATRSTSPSPLTGRSTMAAVWTGEQVIFWGGDSDTTQFDDGAAYDPRTDTWTMLPPSPLDARNANAAVWTGSEVLIWGGSSTDANHRDGAAYDPATQTWRRIADAPFTSEGRSVGLWTGSEMIVLAGFNSSKAGAYDPATDRWRALPDLPANLMPPTNAAMWTGTEVFAAVQGALFGDGSEVELVSLRPGDETWTSHGTLPPGSVALAWTGSSILVAAGGEAFEIRGGRRVPVATAPPGVVPGDGGVAWTGTELVLWRGQEASAIDPEAGTWTTIPGGGARDRTQPALVWADGVLVGWGGFPDVATGVVLRPPA